MRFSGRSNPVAGAMDGCIEGGCALAAHYTLKNFVRQASRSLLSQYLGEPEVDLGFEIGSLKPRAIDPINDALNLLPDEVGPNSTRTSR
jgi:hypothetical protein